MKGTDRTDVVGDRNQPGDTLAIDDAELRDTYLRPWLEYRISQHWGIRALGQARWSSETHFDGTRNNSLETQHLGGIATLVWSPWLWLDIEGGLGIDRAEVEQDAEGDFEFFTHGDRTESRAIISLDFHWNGVRIVLLETLEGDNEGYQTVGFHDKGFAHIVIEF